MIYKDVKKGIFLSRPNRFIAHIDLDGKEVIAHVRNTGRCKELLIPGARVYIEPSDNPNRKTKYSLIAVEKENRIINMDSYAPNKIIEEALKEGKKLEGLGGISSFKAEYKYGKSRLDFLLFKDSEKILAEVKGVTLEENGVVMFPDAPTERGVRHVHELIDAKKHGYLAAVIFVVQMENISYFTPNWKTHPKFGEALIEARKQGVDILAYDCKVAYNEIKIASAVPIFLEENQQKRFTKM